MAAQVYYSPFIPAFNGNGAPVPGAKLYFFYTETNNLAPVYSDAFLTNPLSNPVSADLAGKFPNVYLNDTVVYRVRITDPQGIPLGADIDPYIPGQALKGAPGEPGATGAANSTYSSLSLMKAAPSSRLSYILATPTGPITYSYVTGDFNGLADDLNVIKLDTVSLSTGALIIQKAKGVSSKRAAILSAIRDSQSEFDETVKITQFYDPALGKAGLGNKAADTAAMNRAITFALTNGRAIEIPWSPQPFIFDKLILPRNEQGTDGDTARPTKFTICGNGCVQFSENGFLFDCEVGRYFYDLVFSGSLRFISVAGSGSKFINGDAFIRLFMSPGLQINKFDWGIYSVAYLQSVRYEGVIHRGGNGAAVKAPMSYDCRFKNFIIEFCNDGIVIDGPGNPALNNTSIKDAVIEGMAGRGIVFGGALASSIKDVYMEDNRGGEIFLNASSSAHTGLIVQSNSLAQSADRLAEGAYSIVWGSSLATPCIAGGNYCTGNLHDLTGSSNILVTIGDVVASGKNITRPGIGREISTDGFSVVARWFGRSAWVDPYFQEIAFFGDLSSGATPVVQTIGTNSPGNAPASFDRKIWAKGSYVRNVNASATGDATGWVCTIAGTPGTWKPQGLLP